VILGQIERVHDVDVYAVQLTGGQTIQIEVEAAVHRSAMDALVTLTDDQGTTLAVNDDHGETRDSRIEFTVPVTGRYFVVVQDANDLGGEAHPYRLSLAAAGHPVSFPGQPKISFVGQIAPILQRQCVACHGPRKAEGGYRLDTYHHLVSEGDSGSQGFAAHSPDNSESFRRITSDDVGERMPLDAEPLSTEQVALIQTWIEQGATFDGEDPDGTLISQIPPVTHPDPPEHYAAPLPLAAMAFSPDGQQLLIGGYHEITVWHPTDGKLLRRIGQVGQRTYQITWHPSGEQFAVACGTPGQLGEARIFTRDGQLQQVLAVSPDVIHDVAYNPAGDRIAVAGSDGSIRVYDLEQGTLRLEISSHLDWVLAVAWSPDGSKLASGSRDKTAKVFDAESGRLLASYLRHNAAVRGVLFHPAGDEVYSSGENHRWDRWKVSDAERVKDMHLGGEGFKLLGIGSFFLVPSANNRVHLMKADESDRVRELHGPADRRLLSVAAHEEANRVAAGGHSGEVIVWEFSTGEKIAEFRGFPSPEQD
jgi:WD40 repeat protein